MTEERRLLWITGAVQGVGFRPFIWHQARAFNLAGRVFNSATGVCVDVQGPPPQIDALVALLQGSEGLPPLCRIEAVVAQSAPVLVGVHDFRISPSLGGAAGLGEGPEQGGGGKSAGPWTLSGLPSDAAVCRACLSELFNPDDRRWHHAFIGCTDCGPRFTLALRAPYDRANTTMASFPMCSACAREYDNPASRRFHAQPIACPQCGPRLELELLAGLGEESGGPPPADKASGEGGPWVMRPAPAAASDPIGACWRLLAQGATVAVQGLGGFNLMADARLPQAVEALRQRKRRPDKPFACMALNIASARRWVEMGSSDEALMSSAARPIVVLPLRGARPAPLTHVAPRLAFLGIMLPSTPIHYLLFHAALGSPLGTGWLERRCDVLLIATSANTSGEPLITDPQQARLDLRGIAHALLWHDRTIVWRCDDSVVMGEGGRGGGASEPDNKTDHHWGRVGPGGEGQAKRPSALSSPVPSVLCSSVEGSASIAVCSKVGSEVGSAVRSELSSADHGPVLRTGVGARPCPPQRPSPGPIWLRRARGLVPQALPLPRAGPSTLALGAHKNSTFTLTLGALALPSPHLGDLTSAAALSAYQEAIERALKYWRITPELIACDLQPQLPSSRLAVRLGAEFGAPLVGVQHHHAHVAAVLAEHGIDGPALGLALDGFGWGEDGSAWGGELLLLGQGRARRLGHLSALPLPGGDAAARSPWRMATALLHRLGKPPPALTALGERAARLVYGQIDANFNCPQTTSLGRWFDAVASLAGVCQEQSYEGQAAMELESLLPPLRACPWSRGADGVLSSLGPSTELAPCLPPPSEDLWRLEGLDLDLLPLAERLLELREPVAVSLLWHSQLARALASWLLFAMGQTGVHTAVLAGGCCANAHLMQDLAAHWWGGVRRTNGCARLLRAHTLVPGDGSLSLGQAWVAIERSLQPSP